MSSGKLTGGLVEVSALLLWAFMIFVTIAEK
jgi:hypothetical protein